MLVSINSKINPPKSNPEVTLDRNREELCIGNFCKVLIFRDLMVAMGGLEPPTPAL
jgi:hypothetical protein